MGRKGSEKKNNILVTSIKRSKLISKGQIDIKSVSALIFNRYVVYQRP